MARRDREDRARVDRKGTARAALLARARLLIKAQLGWLGGYPGSIRGGEVAWRGARVDRIDRAAISESTRALKRLIGEHADVLPAAVGDVDAWAAGVTRGLEALKRAVHGGAMGGVLDAATADHAADVLRAHPALAPVIDALAWIRVAAPAAMRKDLNWLDDAAPAIVETLRRADLACVLDLIELVEEEGPRRVAPLIDVLGDPAVHDVVTEGTSYASTVLQRIGNPQTELPAEVPRGKLGASLLQLPAWMLTVPTDARRGALRAVAAAELRETCALWAAVWTAVDREHARREERSWEELKACYDGLKQAIAAAPPPVTGRPLLEAIQRAATRPKILDVLERLPPVPHELSRSSALVRLAAIHDVLDPPQEAAFFDVLRDYLAARGDHWLRAWMAPVVELIDPMRQSTLGRVDRALRTAARWKVFGQALILATRSEARALDGPALDNLAALVRVSTAEAAVEGLRLLRPRQKAIDAVTAEAASALATTPGDLIAMAETLGAVTDAVPASVVTLAVACGPGGAGLVRALIERGERARVIEAAAQLNLADALKLRRRPMLIAPDGEVPPWGTALPRSMHAPLARLCAAGGESIARKLLAETFPDVDALDAEIAAIERKLAASDGEQARRLAARLTNLEHKRDTPKAPSAQRVTNLTAELTAAAELCAFDRWRAALVSRIDAGMPAALDLESSPPWLATPAYRQVVLGILELTGSPRKLAHRLLAARCGPGPWDFRDEPANRAFVARLRRAGVDPAPWVEGIGVVACGAGADALALSLEDDPLEVLRMGAHFETCLAPGAINFFAAVVNAADINKRVIYARGQDGNVVGRCLLALTDAGGILSFHAYCHDERDFTAHVRTFVQTLAARMRTVILPSGSVSTLLDSKWYDDGPEDLTGQFGFLDDDSPFRRELLSLALDRLIPRVTEVFAPLPLAGHTLGLIIALSELDTRPALIVPLMPLLDDRTDVPLETRLRAAELAAKAGRADLAAARLGPDLDAHLRALHRQHRHVDKDLLDRLVVASPSRALAFLRDTRDRGVRSHLDEREPGRLRAAARGHDLLGRPRQAAALYRRAMELHKSLREECEQRLAALG